MRGTLGEYLAYKSYIVRERERAPRPDTQNKIKMILIHILPPSPHSEKHTLLSLGVHRQRQRTQGPAVRARGGGRGAQWGRQEGGQKRGWAKRRILTSQSMLSLTQIARQELNRSAVQHKKTTPRKESPARNRPPSGIARPITLSSESERAGEPYRITPTTQSKKYMTISPSDCFLFLFPFLNCARNHPPEIARQDLPTRNHPSSGIARPCPPVT